MDEPDRHALQAEAQDQGLSEAPHDDDLMHPLKKRKGSRPLPYQDTDYSAQEDVVEVRSSGGRDDLHERVHWQPQDDSPRHHHHQYREHAPQHRQPGGESSTYQPRYSDYAIRQARPGSQTSLDDGLDTTTTGRRSAPASAGGGEYRSTGGAAGGNDYRSAGMRPPMRKDPDARLPSKAGGPSPAEDDPRYQMRQLIIALTKLRGPNSLGQDAVQAALEHSRALLVKAPEAASAPGKPGPAQTGSAGNPSSRDAYCGITEGFLDVLTSVGSLQNAAAGFKTSVANMGATPQLNATAGANDAEGIAMVDRLSSSIKQAKRALLCLETVEVVVANAFTDAVSQLDVVRQQHKAMHDTWEATVRIESISQQRKSYLKSMLRLPADEVGEDLLELFEKLRVNIAGGMDASAQRQQAAADARAMRSRLLLAAYPGLGSATYASSADGDLDTVVEREILRLYTLLRVMQNLYKFAADTAKSLQDTFHNSWWQVPILAGGQLMGTMSSLQASTSSLRTSGVVLHPDFRLPSTLSSRLAAQYFIKGFSNLSDAVKTRVKEAGASLSRRQALSVPVMSSRDRGGYSSQHSPQDQRIPPLRNQLGPRDHYQPGTYPRSQPVQRPPPAAPAEPGPAAMPSLPEARATPPKERRKHGSSARERPEVSSGRAEQERSRLPRSHRDPGGFDGEEGQDPKAADDGDASVGVAGTQSSRDTSLTTEELSNESQPGGKQAHRSAPPQERAEGDVDLELDQSEGKRYEAAAQETSQEWPAASEAQPNASSAAMSAPSPQQAVALSQIHALASALAAHQQGSSAAQHSEAQHSAAQYSPDIMQLVAGLANEPNQHMNAYMQQLRLTMQMAQYQNMLAGQAQSSAPPSQAPAEPASSMQQD
ncbi:hypothetical protein WJX72_001397 [[Myrmecia] bisecta]|uniref:Uncharacterized protein n=1 Tax=[Myrmecia] bisecta TaxID=41462 RepID=A0AAW1PPI1_9CHLO